MPDRERPGGMDRTDLTRWLAAYEAAWRTPGTEPLRTLFADSATYQPAPFDPPLRGRPAIAALWEAEREGADEVFKLTTERIRRALQWAPNLIAAWSCDRHMGGPRFLRRLAVRWSAARVCTG